jgi:hypothetical protein
MKKVTALTSQAPRSGVPLNADDYRDPRDRIITVKLPEPEYRSAKNLARACRIPVSALVRGLILRTAERNKLAASDDREDGNDD